MEKHSLTFGIAVPLFFSFITEVYSRWEEIYKMEKSVHSVLLIFKSTYKKREIYPTASAFYFKKGIVKVFEIMCM
jgi:hypothetical protein